MKEIKKVEFTKSGKPEVKTNYELFCGGYEFIRTVKISWRPYIVDDIRYINGGLQILAHKYDTIRQLKHKLVIIYDEFNDISYIELTKYDMA